MTYQSHDAVRAPASNFFFRDVTGQFIRPMLTLGRYVRIYSFSSSFLQVILFRARDNHMVINSQISNTCTPGYNFLTCPSRTIYGKIVHWYQRLTLSGSYICTLPTYALYVGGPIHSIASSSVQWTDLGERRPIIPPHLHSRIIFNGLVCGNY